MTTQFAKREAIKAKLEQFRNESDDYVPELLVDVARAEVHMYGRIGSARSNGISSSQFAKALKAMNGKDFSLFINSPGGSVDQGWGIGNLLDRYAGTITGVVDGVAASIASYVLCCCKVRLISAASAVMIHNAWSEFAGDAAAMKKESEILQKFSGSITSKYASATRQTVDQIERWMTAETWFFNDETITAGFCSGYFGKPANYRPKLAAARRACLRLKVEAMRDDTRAIFAAHGMD